MNGLREAIERVRSYVEGEDAFYGYPSQDPECPPEEVIDRAGGDGEPLLRADLRAILAAHATPSGTEGEGGVRLTVAEGRDIGSALIEGVEYGHKTGDWDGAGKVMTDVVERILSARLAAAQQCAADGGVEEALRERVAALAEAFGEQADFCRRTKGSPGYDEIASIKMATAADVWDAARVEVENHLARGES